MIDPLIDWLDVRWPIDRLIDWLVMCRLIDWLIDWLVARLIDYVSTDRLIDWLACFVTDLFFLSFGTIRVQPRVCRGSWRLPAVPNPCLMFCRWNASAKCCPTAWWRYPPATAEKKDQDLQKCRNLAIRLSDSVRGDGSDLVNVRKTLDFFCDRLRAPTVADRDIALTGLEIVFDPSRIESAIWGADQAPPPTPTGTGVQDFRSELLPKSKHGISIDHLLMRIKPNAWCPDFIVDQPCKPVSYMEKYGWLLTPDLASLSPHFPVMIGFFSIFRTADRSPRIFFQIETDWNFLT